MGDSTWWEQKEGRHGPKKFPELFRKAKPEYRQEATRLLEDLDLPQNQQLQLRRKLAEAQREREHRQMVYDKLVNVRRLVQATETNINELLPIVRPPNEVLGQAGAILREIRETLDAHIKRPGGGQPRPEAAKAVADLGFIDADQVRVFLRASGIPLSTGRRSKPIKN